MKKKWVQYICIIICVIMTFSLLAGCKANEKELKIAASTEVIEYFDQNGLTEYLGKRANVKVKWLDYGSNTGDMYSRVKEDLGKDEKELPDAYLGLGLYDDDIKLLSDSFFLDLTNLIDTETTEFSRIISEDISRKEDMYTGGGIYSFPSFYEEYSREFPQKIWINTEWLEKVGATMPTDLDELLNVLRLFKESDPNGNGEADEVPLGVAYKNSSFNSLGFIINAFVPTEFDLSDSEDYINVDENGNLYTAVTDERFKDAIKYIKILMDEGLISSDIFEVSASDLSARSSGEEKYGIIAASDIRDIFSDSERLANYEAMPPIGGSEAVSVSRLTKVQMGGYMIGKNTANLESALKFGDAMLEANGTLSIIYGLESTGWDKADGRIGALGGVETTWKLLNTEKVDVIPFESIKGRIPFWYSASLQMAQQAEVTGAGADLKTNANWKGYINKLNAEMYQVPGKRYSIYALPEVVLSQEQKQELVTNGCNRAELYEYLVTTCQAFVTGEKDIDADWDEYVNTLNQKGLHTLIEITQNAYDRSKF